MLARAYTLTRTHTFAHTHTQTHMHKHTQATAKGSTLLDNHDLTTIATSVTPVRPRASAPATTPLSDKSREPERVNDLEEAGTQLQHLTLEQMMLIHELDMDEGGGLDLPEGRPSRHLWLGNIPLKPNKAAMELLFK